MECWICGALEADSYEHSVKASDLTSLFSHISQNNPLYFNSSHERNTQIKSIKKPRKLKFNNPICSDCNNKRTSNHDKAWQHLSEYLRFRNPPIAAKSYFRIKKVFPTKSTKYMIFMHLYFVKQFGCIVNDQLIGLETNTFSESIMQNKPHPNIHLSFSITNDLEKYNMAGPSDLHAINHGGRVVYAAWAYTIDMLNVTVIYAEPEQQRLGLIHSWHPSKNAKRIYLNDFDER